MLIFGKGWCFTMKQRSSERKTRLRVIGLLALSFVIAESLCIAGVLFSGVQPLSVGWKVLSYGLCFVPPVLLGANVLLSNKYARQINDSKAAEINEFMLRQRELAEKSAAENAAAVRRWMRLSTLYAVFLGLVGGCIAFFSGWLSPNDTNGGYVVLTMYAMLILAVTLTRVRLPVSASTLAKEENHLPRQEYPVLYSLADRAAQEMDCRADVHILMQADGNVGIADSPGKASILLGCMLLGVFEEQELYAVLLHEFAHLSGDRNKKIRRYGAWLLEDKASDFLSGISQGLFSFADMTASFHFFLFDFASSLANEAAADQAMLRCGSKETAASALIKIYYYDRFSWEQGTYDTQSDFTEEHPCPESMSRMLREFRERMAERSTAWDGLLPMEIIARNASHPTTKMRLDALGVSDIRILPVTEDGPYAEERDRAIRWMDQLVFRFAETNYGEDRRLSYEEPLEDVRQWEAAGKPIVAEEYRDIADALRLLGRNREAEEVCLRAIDELPEPAAAYALYMTGCIKLHRYDPAGIEPVYRAIEINPNFLDEGVDAIGAFCCITGNREELNRYRDKAMELLQKQADEYDRLNELKKGDDLSAETLPNGALDRILEYIRSIDENRSVDSVYLVRKTISPTCFTSAFVVKFARGTAEDERYRTMHQLFNYLDTESDWQYSLFTWEGAAAAHVEKIPGSLVYQRAIE